jgi:hypothetical protein
MRIKYGIPGFLYINLNTFEIFLRSSGVGFNYTILRDIWKAEDIKNLDLDAIAEEFAEGMPDNVVPPTNIAVYIKEARTPKEAVERVCELVVEFETAVEQENEEIG